VPRIDVLNVPAGGVDLEVFDQEVDRARQARAGGDPSAAASLLRRALALWRGPVCDGLSSPFLDAQRDRLNEWPPPPEATSSSSRAGLPGPRLRRHRPGHRQAAAPQADLSRRSLRRRGARQAARATIPQMRWLT
jgi:Bacterial transcriptional activator domain